MSQFSFETLLEPHYAEAHRHYHTMVHINEILSNADKYFPEDPLSLAELLAIWYHDAVYIPSASKGQNESDSAKLMVVHTSLLFDLNNMFPLYESSIELATQIILDTANHHLAKDASQRVIDLDLAVLGANETRYNEYVAGTRKEYGEFSDAEWKFGRSKFIQSMLSTKRIFFTEQIHLALEDKARANLKNELEVLNAQN